MGMFDEIIVPKSYLRDILGKKDESLFDTNHKFQTKDLENTLSLYKIYRKQLYKARGKLEPPYKNLPGAWDKMAAPCVDKISFHDHLRDKQGNEYWFHFEFGFVDHKLDSKRLVDKTVSSKESRECIQAMWDIEQEIFSEHRQKLSYKFWSGVEHICQRLTNTARNRHLIPYDLRKQAYTVSGRLAHDPGCLNLNKDIEHGTFYKITYT